MAVLPALIAVGEVAPSLLGAAVAHGAGKLEKIVRAGEGEERAGGEDELGERGDDARAELLTTAATVLAVVDAPPAPISGGADRQRAAIGRGAHARASGGAKRAGGEVHAVGTVRGGAERGHHHASASMGGVLDVRRDGGRRGDHARGRGGARHARGC